MFPRICFLGILWLIMPFQGWTQGTTFTYQGRLRSGDNPAAGPYDLTFALYNQAAGGEQQGPVVNRGGVLVSNGLFSVELDFGATALNGEERWLEIGVLKAGDPGPATVLQPRQRLTSTPYATRAAAASTFTGAVGDGQLSGNVALRNADQVFSGSVQFTGAQGAFVGSFSGNGAGLTNLPAAGGNGRAVLTGRITGLPQSSSTAFYGSVSGTSAAEMSEYSVTMLSPNADTAGGNLRVKLSASPGTGKGYVITLRVNGADSALTTTITGSQTAGDSGTVNIAVPAGAELSWKVQAIGTPTVDRAMFGWTLE